MDPLIIALIVAVFTLLVLFSGIPIAFGLSFVSIALLVTFEGFQMLDVFAETFFAGLNSFVLLSIPMFILMGMAVANSPAGKDLYTGLDRWLWRVPGGLVISNIGACSIFAALSGSSPATCAAIGTMGIPEMRKRGYSDQIATGTIAAGGTLGAAMAFWHQELLKPRQISKSKDNMNGSYLGPQFNEEIIENSLNELKAKFTKYDGENLTEKVANELGFKILELVFSLIFLLKILSQSEYLKMIILRSFLQ